MSGQRNGAWYKTLAFSREIRGILRPKTANELRVNPGRRTILAIREPSCGPFRLAVSLTVCTLGLERIDRSCEAR